MLKSHEIQNIKYTKDLGRSGEISRVEITERTIIPTFVPKPNIKAVDVTDLSPEDRDALLALLIEYNEYVVSKTESIFNFEDWVAHSALVDIQPKWRTFKLDNLTLI